MTNKRGMTWNEIRTKRYGTASVRVYIKYLKKKGKNKRKENEKEKMGVYDSVIILHKKFIHLHSAAMGCGPLFQLN